MKEWEQEVVNEQRELEKKIFKLKEALNNRHDLYQRQIILMQKQLCVMREYEVILYDRMHEFSYGVKND